MLSVLNQRQMKINWGYFFFPFFFLEELIGVNIAFQNGLGLTKQKLKALR